MTIGEEVLVHGYIDEIRKDIVIIRNEGGYFGTVPEEIRSSSEIPNTCGDAISRQAVLDLMRGLTRWCVRSEDGKWKNVGLLYDDVIFGIDRLPSVTPQQRTGRWIPVSERVPEDEEEVLCFLGSEEMAVLFLRNDWGQNEWVDGGFATGSYDVVAWMPLPKPYKGRK